MESPRLWDFHRQLDSAKFLNAIMDIIFAWHEIIFIISSRSKDQVTLKFKCPMYYLSPTTLNIFPELVNGLKYVSKHQQINNSMYLIHTQKRD